MGPTKGSDGKIRAGKEKAPGRELSLAARNFWNDEPGDTGASGHGAIVFLLF